MRFHSRSYRFRLWRRDYLRAEDCLNLLALLLTGTLAVLTYNRHPQITLMIGMFYGGIVIWIFFLKVRRRLARDQIQAEVLWRLFSQINKEIFNGDHRTRFTLFRPDSIHRNYITPWYRFVKGGRGPIEEATLSLSRYTRGEGMTGQAWAEAGQSLLLQVFPKFSTREEFENHYVNKLGIDKPTVQELSDYMIGVQTMFCYAFVGHDERTLGVLSLDFQAPLNVEPRPSFPAADDGHQILLDNEHLRLLLRSVQNVLEAFVKSERKQPNE